MSGRLASFTRRAAWALPGIVAAAGSSCAGGDVARVETSRAAVRCRPPDDAPPFRFVDAFGGLSFERPVAIARAGEVYFVVEQAGRVRRVRREGSGWTSALFVDLGARLAQTTGEGGLLGFAPSPDLASTGEVFVAYTGRSDESLFRVVIARLRTSGEGTADLASEDVVLAIERDAVGHNGGRLVFGPDRQLYIGVGDGSWGDPLRRAQDPDQLFGKVLRIDVLGGRPYGIPADNPFASGGGRPEVYALGLRNPWSFSFDERGRLWLGDVGHGRWEEIDLVTKGGNYEWPLREGRHCLDRPPCEVPGGTAPVLEYPHVDGFAVIGGVVYRGRALPLAGRYVFGDFMTGRIWTVDADRPDAPQLLFDSGMTISGIAEDAQGELLVVDYAGRVVRVAPLAPRARPPVTLRALGCLDEEDPTAMSRELVPYEVNAGLWSDGLDKRRWVSLPEARTIHVREDGAFDVPPGAFFLKELSSGGRRIETRMLVHDAESGWLGYAFEWNEAQTDATLLDGARTVEVEGGTWTIPGRSQCFACHTNAAGRVLGFEAPQLNRRAIGAHGETPNQLDVLGGAGLFDRPIDPATASAFADPHDTAAPLEARARAYLHANCSSCHRSWASMGGMDLRATVPLAGMNLLCRPSLDGDLDLQPFAILPGDPGASRLVARMAATDAARMPPLGSSRTDAAGFGIVSEWITSLSGCP
jgi:uncharacterized repeat protein (TIGR03806 family)